MEGQDLTPTACGPTDCAPKSGPSQDVGCSSSQGDPKHGGKQPGLYSRQFRDGLKVKIEELMAINEDDPVPADAPEGALANGSESKSKYVLENEKLALEAKILAGLEVQMKEEEAQRGDQYYATEEDLLIQDCLAKLKSSTMKLQKSNDECEAARIEMVEAEAQYQLSFESYEQASEDFLLFAFKVVREIVDGTFEDVEVWQLQLLFLICEELDAYDTEYDNYPYDGC